MMARKNHYYEKSHSGGLNLSLLPGTFAPLDELRWCQSCDRFILVKMSVPVIQMSHCRLARGDR